MRYNDADIRRGERCGIPEVVLALGKSDSALTTAIDDLVAHHPVLVTRCSKRQMTLLVHKFGRRIVRMGRESGCMVIRGKSRYEPKKTGRVAVLCAGAADLSIAEEATISAEYLGLEPLLVPDCGIAGPHRVDRAVKEILRLDPDSVIVIAGMEGALPSVICARIRHPVIAVPTSVGYGAHYEGIAPLLAMLNACVPGITVVNIDNGFGAAVAAARISGTRNRTRKCR